MHCRRRSLQAVEGLRPGDGLEQGGGGIPEGRGRGARLPEETKASMAHNRTETTHGHGRATEKPGKGIRPSISFQATHGWRDAACQVAPTNSDSGEGTHSPTRATLPLEPLSHSSHSPNCTSNEGRGCRRGVSGTSGTPAAANGRTPPFPRAGTGQTPAQQSSRFFLGEKKKERETRADGPPTSGHHPSAMRFPRRLVRRRPAPSLIETSLVRNSLARSSDRCTHGSGIQKVGTSSVQIGLTKTMFSGRPLWRPKSPKINRVPAPTAWIRRARARPFDECSRSSWPPRPACVLRAACCADTVIRAVSFDTETLSILFPQPDVLRIWLLPGKGAMWFPVWVGAAQPCETAVGSLPRCCPPPSPRSASLR